VGDIRLNLAKSISELHFLYKTRQHPEVDSMLSGEPPQFISQHLNYINVVQGMSRWIYVASVVIGGNFEAMFGYSQVYDVTEDTVEIGFVVHPDFQGKGYGKSLVLKTIQKAKENFPDKKVILYVLRKNKKAIYIYEKLGFIAKELSLSDEDTLGMELVHESIDRL